MAPFVILQSHVAMLHAVKLHSCAGLTNNSDQMILLLHMHLYMLTV